MGWEGYGECGGMGGVWWGSAFVGWEGCDRVGGVLWGVRVVVWEGCGGECSCGGRRGAMGWEGGGCGRSEGCTLNSRYHAAIAHNTLT